jgi:hypoxanthine phosphoribosyltransferase
MTFIYIFIDIYIINKKIKQYPEWIDPKLNKVLERKYNSDILNKTAEVVSLTYLEWKELVTYMDILVDKIKRTGIKFDSVVGIKSGGAIMTKYIANKLNLKYYYVKISDSDYKCNKKSTDTFDYFFKYFMKKKKSYMMCEAIDEDMFGEKVLLIDEALVTGKSMKFIIDYLYNNKKVSYVLPSVIVNSDIKLAKNKYNLNLLEYNHKLNENILVVLDGDGIFLWPWGFEN